MNPDGSGQMDLSNDPATADFDPAWSPDGTRSRGPAPPIRATTTSGSCTPTARNQTKLTTDPGFDCYPAWSPDGTKIAFAR